MKNRLGFYIVALLLTTASAHSQWAQVYGPVGFNFRAFVINGPNIFAGNYNQGVHLSTDNGDTWTPMNSGLSTDVLSMASHSTYLFAGTNNHGVYRSGNSGLSWEPVTHGGISEPGTVYSLFDAGAYLFAGDNPLGAFVSSNFGGSWLRQDDGMNDGCVYAFTSSPIGGGGMRLFAGTSSGVYRSTDVGGSWSRDTVGMPRTFVRALAVAGDGSGTIYAGTDSGMFVSTDNGDSWSRRVSGMTYTTVRALAVTGNHVFAGTRFGGIYRSTNYGVNWTPVNADFSDDLMVLGVNDTFIFAGTNDKRIFRRLLSEVVTAVDEPAAQIPEAFSIEQNYPNPFNPITTIRYHLPSGAQVRLAVFNMLGQEVRELANEVQGPGSKTVSFDAGNLPSGVYTCRFTAGTYTDVKKMVLMK